MGFEGVEKPEVTRRNQSPRAGQSVARYGSAGVGLRGQPDVKAGSVGAAVRLKRLDAKTEANTMNPLLSRTNYSVSAHCPTCKAVTSFDQRQLVIVPGPHMHNGQSFQRVLYILSQCARCARGAFAAVLDNGNAQSTVLEAFFPISPDTLPLPASVPADVQAEFREAELCAAFRANRAASALFRSVLEKTLKANGYIKGNDKNLTDLQKRIDYAAADGVITDARRKRAHEDVRSLGNDVLHDDWREVADDEVEDAHRYTQRILEDLYDDRPTVEAILIAKKRLPIAP
jgi:Domain of unknown function (DUF4145)